MPTCCWMALTNCSNSSQLRQTQKFTRYPTHTCALLLGGAVSCWGNNASGQLGDNSTTGRKLPASVMGLPNRVASLSAGRSLTCAVLESGDAKCWGANGEGQLGDNSIINRTSPVTVQGLASDVSKIFAGIRRTCVLLVGGRVKCWGLNNVGQLGDDSYTNRMTPVDVSTLGSGVYSLSLGKFHTCALLSNGGVKCWGNNDNGQLGCVFR